VLTW